jgi:hypothetical protein
MHNHNEKSSTNPRFKERRRRWVDQIMRDLSLPIVVRLVGCAVGQHLNRTENGGVAGAFGATFSHPSFIAQKLGIKFQQAADAIAFLERRSYLKKMRRGARDYLCAMWRDDAPLPLMRSGGREFARERGEWLDMVMLDAGLHLTQRAVGYLIANLVDPETGECDASHRWIGDLLNVSPATVCGAVKALRRAGWINGDGAPMALSKVAKWPPAFNSRSTRVQSAFSGRSDNSAKSNTYGRNPVDLVNLVDIQSPSDSAPSATRRGHAGRKDDRKKVSFTRAEFERFDQLVGLIVDHSKGGDHKTVAGILAVSGALADDNPGGMVGADVFGCPYYPAEIQKFVRAGLLQRDGDRISVTDLGWRCVDWFEHREQEAA